MARKPLPPAALVAPKMQNPQRERQQRIEPRCQIQITQQLGRYPAAAQPDGKPQPELQEEAHQRLPYTSDGTGQQFGESDGEKDRHRIVGTGFDLERCSHALVEIDALPLEHGKDRCGVRRADDRPHQQAFGKRQIH